MSHKTVKDYVTDAAKNYLQTVVFVDDQIYQRDGGIAASKLKKGFVRRRKLAILKEIKENEENSEEKLRAPEDFNDEIKSDEQHLSSRDLLNSFAKKRMVCSLYQPEERAAYSKLSDVYQLCLAADVVVLDWVLHGDDGEHTLELVDNIIQQSIEDEPEQLRLIVVYTDKDNLGVVADRLYGRLSDSITHPDDIKKNSNGLALHTMNSRIVVFGKPNPRRGDNFRDYVKEEKELADAVIQEFAKLADGLLQACVLNGLAAIKRNSRKIITKFASHLDPAFLTHRALSLENGDAYDDVNSLIADEIGAVLEDSITPPLIADAIIQDWCESYDYSQFSRKHIHEDDLVSFASEFCAKGKAALDLTGLKKTPGKKHLQDFLCPDLNQTEPYEPDTSSMAEFASLMSQRTYYDSARKVLQLGVVIREIENEKRFFICLQPACDCVRLRGCIPFVFCQLLEADLSLSKDGPNLVIEHNNDLVGLSFEATKCHRFIFNFDADTSGCVVAKEDNEIKFVFSDTNSMKYQWLSRLKSEHAQQAAEKFSRELSRVGVTGSEWLRLRAK